MEKKKILIAEDDYVSYEYLRELLRDTNVEVLLAETGTKAVNLCLEDPEIVLVFMDIKMPQMDGKQATKSIKAKRPDLPVIAQTAYALDNERQVILNEGFDAYLAKPIQRREVQDILNKYL